MTDLDTIRTVPRRAIWREAVAGLLGGGRREALSWILVALTVTGGVAADSSAMATLARDQRDYASNGGYMLKARGGTTPIDARRCVSLVEEPGITASAALDRRIATPLVAGPSSQVQLVEATSGIRALDTFSPGEPPLAASWPPYVALSGTELRQRLGAPLGASVAIRTNTGAVPVSLEEAPTADPTLGGALIVERPPTGPAEECLVRTEPWAFDIWASGGLQAALGMPVRSSVTPLIDRTNEPFARQAATRDGPWLVAGSGILAGLLLAASWQLRRSDASLYGSLGLSRSSTAALFQIRALVGLTALVIVLAGVITVSAQIADYELVALNLRQLAVVWSAALTVTGLSATVLGASSHFEGLKDR